MTPQPSLPLIAPPILGSPQPQPASDDFWKDLNALNLDGFGTPAGKSFGILVDGIREGTLRKNRVIGAFGDHPSTPKPGAPGPPGDRLIPAPEARYAYYLRCQHFRRNGEQCKAPAMKGEQICHSHAVQLDAERRRQEQRHELLSRPGTGFESLAAIQRTLGEVVNSLLEGKIDCTVAGRLMVEIQVAIRLAERKNHKGHEGTQREEGRSDWYCIAHGSRLAAAELMPPALPFASSGAGP
jgi:hypothetical protein